MTPATRTASVSIRLARLLLAALVASAAGGALRAGGASDEPETRQFFRDQESKYSYDIESYERDQGRWNMTHQLAEAHHKRGLVRDNLKNYRGWLEDEEAAIRYDPSVPYYYWGRGNAKSWLGDYEGQIADFEIALSKAIVSAPKEDQPGYQDRLRDARRDFTFNIEERDHPTAHRSWKTGRAQQEKGDHGAAAAEFALAIAADPLWAIAHHERGFSRRQFGDVRGAVEEGALAVSLDPSRSELHYIYALALGDAGRHEEQLQELQKSVECAEAEYLVADHARYAKDLTAAYHAVAEPILAVKRDHPDAHAAFALGLAEYAAGRYENSLRAHARALELFPGFARCRERLATEQKELPFNLEARDQPDAYASFAFGREREAAGQFTEAVDHYRWATEFDPAWLPAHEARLRAATAARPQTALLVQIRATELDAIIGLLEKSGAPASELAARRAARDAVRAELAALPAATPDAKK